MNRKHREIELLVLTMFAAVPLYFTFSVSIAALVIFHVILGAIAVRVAMGKGPALIPARLMRAIAIAYIPFYLIDWRVLSGSAIAASTHLVLFIALYQPIESLQRDNRLQRLLTASLIFIASIATSFHMAVLPFILAFVFLMFRQLMVVSHLESARIAGADDVELPTARTAGFYVIGAGMIALFLFPLLPRVRSPLVQGIGGPNPRRSTGLSESINFGEGRVTSQNTAVISRVWVDRRTRQMFDAIRLRGTIYDRYDRDEWRQTYRGYRELPSMDDAIAIAKAKGVESTATVQQVVQRGKVLLPVGAVSVSGMPARLFEGPTPQTYHTYYDGMLNLSVQMAYQAEPLQLTRVAVPKYPVLPEVAALARRIVGTDTTPVGRARRIEQYLMKNYRYVPNPASLGKTMSVDDFLLRERAGHCEYFAAGMVVLLTALDVPSRIAGGYYGGRYNPITGYYVIRRSDAHAWTEVWDGTRWLTFDSTPEVLRPGASTGSVLREYVAALGDSLNFVWDRYILSFGLADQLALAEDLLVRGRATLASLRQKLSTDALKVGTRQYGALAAIVIALGAMVALIVRRRRSLFDALARYLKKHGIEVGPAMTMEEALDQLRRQHPDAARELAPLIAMYEEERFSSHEDRKRRTRIRRKLAELRA